MSKKPTNIRFETDSPMSSGYMADYEEYAREHWGPLVSTLQAENQRLRDKVYRYERDLTKGVDVGVLMKAIAENPATLTYWNKILMLLRLEEK